jgi:tripartite ATP-independent transporter DctP family solute receptor
MRELEKASPDDNIEEGEIKVEFYDQGMVGTERQLLEACYFGAIEVVQVNSSVVSSVNPIYSLLDLPYVFVSDEHLKEVLNGEIGEALLDDLNTMGMQGLGFYTAGFRNIFYKSNGPCASNLSEMNGMKIRVMESPVMVNAINAIGLSATPIPFSELYQSLKTGVVDGAENSANIFVSYNYEETGCNCFTLTEHFTNQHVMVANSKWLNSIDPKYKRRIQRVAKDILPEFNQLWDEAIERAYQDMKASHVTVNAIVNKKEFVERTQPIINQFFLDHPKVDQTLHEKIRKSGEKYLNEEIY